ncbi:MAG: hypothetical protein Q8M24_00160 [Pseudolabrys sp.]|nr:hypothetical protein [Pseudolabrys sp.]MDP2293861.1 hypothetical protein [Pseudolabrys sp.]
MLLGDLLAELSDETAATEAILSVNDLPMLAAMRERAQADGIDLPAYVAGTVRRYASEASDEEWITLMGLLNRAPDPGAVCLKRAFEHALHG